MYVYYSQQNSIVRYWKDAGITRTQIRNVKTIRLNGAY